MEYVINGNRVQIHRGVHYTTLRVVNLMSGEELYFNSMLPKCRTRIECEDNCERIAKQYTKE